jgi:argininosuccinate lyase
LVAKELGFNYLVANSIDGVASRDHLLEFMSFGAILMVHLSRLAEDIILWCSAEFGFATLPDALCTTSSMMPQKKNPDGAELMRGKAGRTIGNLITLLTIVKGLPLSYNRDLQEDKEPLFDTVETLKVVLPLATEIVTGLEFDLATLRLAADDPYMGATDLADHLVLRGLPFRLAHEQVGALVTQAQQAGLALRDISPAMLRKACPKADPQILSQLKVDDLIKARNTTPGGTSYMTLQAQIAQAYQAIETWLAAASDSDSDCGSASGSSGSGSSSKAKSHVANQASNSRSPLGASDSNPAQSKLPGSKAKKPVKR